MRRTEFISLKCPRATESFKIAVCKAQISSVASVRPSLISKQLGETKRAHKSLTRSAEVKQRRSAILSDSILRGALIKALKVLKAPLNGP